MLAHWVLNDSLIAWAYETRSPFNFHPIFPLNKEHGELIPLLFPSLTHPQKTNGRGTRSRTTGRQSIDDVAPSGGHEQRFRASRCAAVSGGIGSIGTPSLTTATSNERASANWCSPGRPARTAAVGRGQCRVKRRLSGDPTRRRRRRGGTNATSKCGTIL